MRSVVGASVVFGILLAFLPGASVASGACEVEYAELKDMGTQELTEHYCGYGRVVAFAKGAADQSRKSGSPTKGKKSSCEEG